MNLRLEALRRRHTEIDNNVRLEALRPAPDSVAIRVLKKMRLRLKDEIQALMRAKAGAGLRTSATPADLSRRIWS